MNNLGEKGAWVYPGTSQFFSVLPIISGTCKATNFKFGRYTQSSEAPYEQKPIKNLEEKGAVEHPYFWVSPYYLRNG